MKDCSAISRVWRTLAVLVALVGVSGCQEPFVGLDVGLQTLERLRQLGLERQNEGQNQTSTLERLKRTNVCPNCDLQGADLQGYDLREANLRGANLLLANLRGANLQGADLQKANLQEADLREANLRDADLRDADLRGADLIWALLYEADLQSADLRGANLQGANLRDADLWGANLYLANLRYANLRGAKLDSDGLAIARASGAIGLDPAGSEVANKVIGSDVAKAVSEKPKPVKRVAKTPPPPKPSLPTTIARDRTPPTITIASAITVKTDSPTIKGRASDNTLVAQVTVEGVAVDLKSDGSFSFSRYVPTSGTTVHIEAIDEWGNKAQKVVRLSRKAVQTTAKARDTTPPTIRIASAITVKTDSPTIKGQASDNTQVAQVTVEGVAVDLKSDGSFSFKYYVPVGGANVKIEAFDKWGNRSERTVKITRAVAKATDQLTLAKLNPTNIRGRSNKDAIALIIGVANYSRAPAATYADNDANVFGDFAHRALGIPRSNIKVLVNDKASNTVLKVTVKRWLRGRIEEGKTDVHVFFAGHGLASPDGKDLYLLPYDGETSLLDETALLRRELFEVIDKAKPKSATIFLDTCYSGLSRGKETLLASARGIVVTPKPQSIPRGFTVLSAASGQQISSGLDEAKHGLFSYYLMKGMEGDADANKDRKITAGELHAYLGKNVQKQAIRLGREQTPELSGDGERVLVRW